MQTFIDLYNSYKDWIELIKDLVFFAGAITAFKIIRDRKFSARSKEIDENLSFRKKIEEDLQTYVSERSELKNKDIGIRFVHWKNYPWNLNDDAYKHHLFLRYFDEQTHPYGFIDNTGIYFQEHVWWFSQSIYVDNKGIFFFDRKELKIEGFKEIPNCVLVFHLPYKNIINFDFREYIEYEPVFYIRYPYNNRKNLYDNKITIREKLGNPPMRHELFLDHMMKKKSFLNYNFLKFKLWLMNYYKTTS